MNRGFLLDRLATWRDEPALCSGVTLADVMRLSAGTDEPRPLADAYGSFGGLADPTGAAAGRDGRAYLVDRAGQVRRWDGCDRTWLPLPCLAGWGIQARGIAGTASRDLAVADAGNRRLVILAPDGVAVRRLVPLSFEPWDVAADGRGRLLVSDPAGGLVHVLRCTGTPLSTWDGFTAPTALAVDRDGRVYVVQDGLAAVQVRDGDGHLVETRETTEGLVDRFCPPDFVVGPDGVVALASQTPPPAPRYAPAGTFVTTALDSRLHRCPWHRVRLDATVPAGGSVTVHALTADVPLSAAEVAALPEDRWRGGQVHGTVGDAPWDCLLLCPPGRYLWLRLGLAGSGASTPQIRAVAVGYPRITSTRFLPAVYREEPVSADFTERFVALLDAVRDTVTARIDGVAALFDPATTPETFLGWLGSWLGLAADLKLPTARRRRLLAQAHRLYRLRGTPAGVRAHLEICLGLPVRLLEDFTLRRWLFVGSGRLGERAAVWDADVVRRLQLDAGAQLGTVQLVGSTDPLRDPFHVYAHRFRVYVPAAESDDLRRLAERVLELAKPAHTDARLVFVTPRMRVGVQAFLGVDSVIGAYPSGVATGTARLNNDAVLTTAPAHPSLRVGRTTRVGTSTVLD
jgi:phage tail-like protein